MSSTEPNILFLLPQYGGNLTTPFFESMLEWAQIAGDYSVKWNWLTDPFATLLPMARSQLVQYAMYMDDWTHICMIDHDMGWTPKDLCDLIFADKDIIGALAPVKCYPLAQNSSSDYAKGISEWEGPLAKCKYVGTGMMVIKRESIERMHDVYADTLTFKTVDGYQGEQKFMDVIDLFACVTNGGHEDDPYLYLTEDYAFCQRARDAGLEVWSHTEVNPSHTGQHTFSFEGEAKMMERYARKLEQIKKENGNKLS